MLLILSHLDKNLTSKKHYGMPRVMKMLSTSMIMIKSVSRYRIKKFLTDEHKTPTDTLMSLLLCDYNSIIRKTEWVLEGISLSSLRGDNSGKGRKPKKLLFKKTIHNIMKFCFLPVQLLQPLWVVMNTCVYYSFVHPFSFQETKWWRLGRHI